MDTDRFDRLSRAVARVLPRRTVAGILGYGALALPGLIDARKKKRKKRKKPCRPESPGTTCAGRCGTVRNTCRQAIACLPCPDGQFCLNNASCATVCDPEVSGSCPERCGCTGPSSDGALYCGGLGGCEDNLQVCEHTSECPAGSACLLTECGEGGAKELRCLPLCDQ